jgi:hypothetical protein
MHTILYSSNEVRPVNAAVTPPTHVW